VIYDPISLDHCWFSYTLLCQIYIAGSY